MCVYYEQLGKVSGNDPPDHDSILIPRTSQPYHVVLLAPVIPGPRAFPEIYGRPRRCLFLPI